MALDGSLLPPIQEGQNEDGYDDDNLGYYANYLTESHDISDVIIPPIAALECASHRAELRPPFDQLGLEQGNGEGLLGDHPDVSAASEDLSDSTSLGQHLLLFDYLAEPVIKADDGHLHHHTVWMTEAVPPASG